MSSQLSLNDEASPHFWKGHEDVCFLAFIILNNT